MTVLVVAEHDNQQLKSATLVTIQAANFFKQEIHVLVAGFNCNSVAEQTASLKGVTKVLLVDHESYANPLAENIAEIILSVANNFSYILAPADTYGKNFLPRVAAKLDMAMISDVMRIIDDKTFIRPIYAGNVLAIVQASDPIKILSIRISAFDKVGNSDTIAPIEKLPAAKCIDSVKYVDSEFTKFERPELNSAKIIISGGRGLQSKENFQLLERIADRLHAAIGASRAAVDAGYVPNDFQVGQTGKIVAPDLYIAVGISGAIQHLAGMKESKIIVAINKDPDAAIFQYADFGIVGDLFEILPKLDETLAKLGY